MAKNKTEKKESAKEELVEKKASEISIKFLADRKKEMKESVYRKRFDDLCDNIDSNIMNTDVSYGQKLYEKNTWGSTLVYTKNANGSTDVNMYPQRLQNSQQSTSGTPVSQEPIAFSKIMTAASVLGGKLPDATTSSDNKVYSRAMYDLWKRTWTNNLGNGQNTLTNVFQNQLTYGWAAWRVYPRRVQVKRKGVDKIIFDDVYREALDPRRTWLGVGFNNYDRFSQFEVYYEKDIPIALFKEMYPEAVEYDGELDYCCGVSQESKEENNDNAKNMVTIGYYENMLANRFIVACGDMLIYDGEMPNDESFGSIVVTRCFARNMHDPYGVGFYEMMRGNTAIYTYINSLNAQQVEAEISPLLFGPQVQNGTGTYRRGPNIINPKTPGTTIDVVRTTGNVSQGIQFANQQKLDIEENTGINNIVAGQSSDATLGGTVILAEAALKRLIIPRNNTVAGLELDAQIAVSWIKQTYSNEKIFLIDTDESLSEFIKQNPDYFIESNEIIDENDVFKGYAVAASPNLRLEFDFTEEGDLIEDIPARKLSASALFREMDEHGIQSPYITFTVDPTSMLLPSQEIERQQYSQMFPVITNQLTQIFAVRAQDPQAAASQLKALECLLKTYKENIYSYMSKQVYDEIMGQEMPESQMGMKVVNAKMDQALNPEGEMEGEMPGQGMTQDGTDPMQPQNAGEMARPQSPLGSSMDASVGYASAMPFTPNK